MPSVGKLDLFFFFFSLSRRGDANQDASQQSFVFWRVAYALRPSSLLGQEARGHRGRQQRTYLSKDGYRKQLGRQAKVMHNLASCGLDTVVNPMPAATCLQSMRADVIVYMGHKLY